MKAIKTEEKCFEILNGTYVGENQMFIKVLKFNDIHHKFNTLLTYRSQIHFSFPGSAIELKSLLLKKIKRYQYNNVSI